MKWRWDREYEVRVPCDVHGEVWARVVRRYRYGSPESVLCPACRRQAEERSAATGREVTAPELTLLGVPAPGQARELDALAAAERELGEFGPGELAAHGEAAGNEDDGQ